MSRPRLLPLALAGMAALLVVKLAALRGPVGGPPGGPTLAMVSSAAANTPPAPARPPPPSPPTAAPEAPSPEAAAERAILETLRARRSEMDAREALLAQREMLAAAAERRLSARLEELSALHARLEAESRTRDERAEQGWRQMVRLYEGMRPRDAAGIFDELEMTVLVQVVDRMREAKAAPILAAMRQERARLLTTELARHRAGGT
jgi:flagellar motility protein MotE (MotC chaperone)